MPRVSDEHKAEMRQRIRDAAITVAARSGLGATTMADIISESGLSAGAIYGYYKGKEQIVLDIGSQVLGGRRDALVELTAQEPVPPPSAVLTTLLAGLPENLVEQGLLLQFWGAGATSPEMREQAYSYGHGMLEAMTGYLDRWLTSRDLPPGTARQEAARLAPTMASLAQGYVVQRALGIDVDLERYRRAVDELLSGALSPDRPAA